VKYALFFTKQAEKEFLALDRYVQRKIKVYLEKHVLSGDPRAVGKPLTENLSGHWRYRIGDYRVICAIHDDALEIVAVRIGHHSRIYR
jgi:mRNA interferase RelE/StbE